MPRKAMQTPGELDKWNSADSDSTSSIGSFLSKDLGSPPSTASSSVNSPRTSLKKVQVDSAPFTLREAPPILEILPVEIFILIFKEISDSECLRSFLLSSPLLLPIYRLAKQEILPCILRNQYGPLLGEAVAAVRSRGLYLETHKDEAINLLDTWRRSDEVRKLAPESFSRIDVPRNEKEMRDLFRLHKVLRFFLKDFEKSAMWPLWVDSKTWRNPVLPLKLFKTEQYRFLRALCRLHTHANIFGRAEYPLDDPVLRNNWREDEITERFSLDEEAYHLFFSTMPPWECDEMSCVWRYLSDKINCLYPGVCDSLTNLMGEHGLGDHNWFEELPQSARPVYCAVFNSLPSLQSLSWSISSLVAVGPDFVYRLLHATPILRHEMVLSNADYTTPSLGVPIMSG